jgi:predicted alpha-1,6-mannanase (GH76 family)
MIANLALLDAKILPTAQAIFNTTYSTATQFNPAPRIEKPNPDAFNTTSWLDGFYDDDAWWALAWIAAWDATQEAEYLELAEGIFEDLTQQWPTSCGNGGIWWSSPHNVINAIANELFFSLAAHLANRVPDNKEYYVSWAEKEWEWFQTSGMINSQNLINDGLTATCENNGGQVWTYNQGVILGGLVELYRATTTSNSSTSDSYLHFASLIALAAITNLTTSSGVLRESCEPNCGGDGTQFKGIFIRNLQLLNAMAPNAAYANVTGASAASIWANDRDDQNLFSVSWGGPFVNAANASTHSSAMDTLVAAVALEK